MTTSEQSRILGVPVAPLGFGYFAVMLALSLPALWRSPRPEVRLGRLALAVGGILFVGWLVIAELFIVDAICLWCTAAHVVAVAPLGVVAIAAAVADPTDLRARDL